MDLMIKSTKDTITSLELLEQINLFRSEDNRAGLGHNDLLKVIRDEFEEEISLGKISQSTYKNRGKDYPMFNLTINQSKQVLVRESKYVRKAVITYLEKLENHIKENRVPTNFKEALLLAVAQQEEIERLELENNIKDNKIKEDEPKVNFADRITNSSDAVDIGSFVKVLYDEDIKIGRNKFFEWLRVNKYLMDGNMPYQRYVDNGYFKVIEVIKNTVYGEKIFPKTLITGKGQFNIAEKLRIEFNTSSN